MSIMENDKGEKAIFPEIFAYDIVGVQPLNEPEENDYVRIKEDQLDQYVAITFSLVKVLDAYEGKNPLFSCQGQSMDGYSALANFVDIAKQARKLFANDSEIEVK